MEAVQRPEDEVDGVMSGSRETVHTKPPISHLRLLQGVQNTGLLKKIMKYSSFDLLALN